jgi:hypothetical protein
MRSYALVEAGDPEGIDVCASLASTPLEWPLETAAARPATRSQSSSTAFAATRGSRCRRSRSDSGVREQALTKQELAAALKLPGTVVRLGLVAASLGAGLLRR